MQYNYQFIGNTDILNLTSCSFYTFSWHEIDLILYMCVKLNKAHKEYDKRLASLADLVSYK